MAIDITDVGTENQSASASPPSEEFLSENRTEQQLPPAAAAIAAPRARGRPVGSKDRPARAASSHDLEEGEEEKPLSPRPLTRQSTVRPQPRRVQVVEESDSEEEEEEEETPPPSPRTRRHQEWTGYRQQKADAHQANVNHYATPFARMLA